MSTLSLAIAAVIALLLGCAAWRDFASRIIPDGIALCVALAGLSVRLADGWSAALASLALATLLFVLLVLVHARGMLGGGDVKLAAAIALGLPPESLWGFVQVTAFTGGGLALLHLALRPVFRGVGATPAGRVANTLRRVLSAERWRIARHGSLPYGVAIACGGVWAVWSGSGG